MGLFLASFGIMLLIGVPIALALGLAAFVYLLVTGNLHLMMVFPQKMFVNLNQFVLLTVPLFLLAGSLMSLGGITERVVGFANACVGHVRGGLSLVTVVSCMFFSGVSGAATADVAAVGSVLIPAMVKAGYPRAYAAGLTAVSAVNGPIIPPSIIMIIYGALSGTSIAQLFVAGIVPGIMLALGLLAYAWWVARRRNYAPATRMTMRERVTVTASAAPALVLPVIILGGILAGVFTPTESAAVAVLYALVISAVVYRTLSWRTIWPPLVETTLVTSGILFIVAMASMVQFIFSFERLPEQIAQQMLGITENRYLLILMVNALLLVLGCILDPMAALILALPVLLEVAEAIKIDPVHFGMIVIINLSIGLATPPVGFCLFIAGAIGRVSLEALSWTIVPMLGVCLVVLLLVSFIPELSLFLPSLAFGR
jgi:tripartite ATP-independent transporter DctM subunit